MLPKELLLEIAHFYTQDVEAYKTIRQVCKYFNKKIKNPRVSLKSIFHGFNNFKYGSSKMTFVSKVDGPLEYKDYEMCYRPKRCIICNDLRMSINRTRGASLFCEHLYIINGLNYTVYKVSSRDHNTIKNGLARFGIKLYKNDSS